MHSILSRLRTVITRFARNESGNVIILVAGALLVMVIAVGVAVDLAREQTLQSSMANAADAAALASGVAVSNAIQTGGACVSVLSDSTKLAACETTVAQDAANKFYKVNFPNQYQSTAFTPVVTLDEAAGTITLTAQTTETTDFLSSVGVTSVPVNVYSKVKLATGTCGPSNGVPTGVMPTANSQLTAYSLCTSTGGTASAVAGNSTSQSWTWTCTPSSGGVPVSCSAPLLGTCGAAGGTTVSSAPTGSSLCTSGTPTVSTANGDGATTAWTWGCNGTPSNVATNNSACSANLKGVCNTSVSGSASAPSGTLCSAGELPSSSTPVNSSIVNSNPAGTTVPEGYWTWSCVGTGGSVSGQCSSPLNGSVGSANTIATTTKPADTDAKPDILCITGTASAVSGNGTTTPWTWECVGSTVSGTTPAGTTAYGSAPLDGSCGSANGSDSYSTKPANTSTDATVLCASGNAPSVSGSGTSKDPWSWTCDGSAQTTLTNYGTVAAGSPSAACTATGVTATVTPINGVCGPANGQTYNNDLSAVAAGLCETSADSTPEYSTASTVACPKDSKDTNCWSCAAGNSTGKSVTCGEKLACGAGTYGTYPNCTSCQPETITYYVRPTSGYYGFAINKVACNTNGGGDGCPAMGLTSTDFEDISGGSGNNTRFDFKIYNGKTECYKTWAANTSSTTTLVDEQPAGDVDPLDNECYVLIWGYHSAYVNTYGLQTATAADLMALSGGTLTYSGILKSYLTIPLGSSDTNAKNCGTQYVNTDGTLKYITLNQVNIISPLKVNINGGDATVNSDTPMTFSLTHRGGGVQTYNTVGSLNSDEAWLMFDRKGNGLVHDGVVDGDDLFTDHDGKREDAYEDLAKTFASSLKTDEHGRSYIPLHKIEDKKRAQEKEAREARHDKRAGKERDIDPSLDLKLLDINNNVLFASDYFDRIYVDHANVAMSDAEGKNFILAVASVRDLHGNLRMSADQWFNAKPR